MSNDDKWRREADRLLASTQTRHRDLTTVIGRVEDRFDNILAARRRGMSWKAIAKALEHGGAVTVAAAESAFKRVCTERDIIPPSRRQSVPKIIPQKCSEDAATPNDQPALFPTQPERWVDDGY